MAESPSSLSNEDLIKEIIVIEEDILHLDKDKESYVVLLVNLWENAKARGLKGFYPEL